MQTDALTASANAQSQEAFSRYLWMAIILGFFMIQAVIWTVAITLTSSDPSHAVVPGYDKKAINWNEQVALQKASEALGWQAEIEVESATDIHGYRRVLLTVVDRDRQPVAGATVSLQAFHRGRIAEAQTVELQSIAPGVYASTIRTLYAGIWQFRGSVESADDIFLFDVRKTIQVASR